MSRLRLLKVTVQPVFVLDDGETLEEKLGETITLTPADLDTFPASLWEQIESYNAQQTGQG